MAHTRIVRYKFYLLLHQALPGKFILSDNNGGIYKTSSVIHEPNSNEIVAVLFWDAMSGKLIFQCILFMVGWNTSLFSLLLIGEKRSIKYK